MGLEEQLPTLSEHPLDFSNLLESVIHVNCNHDRQINLEAQPSVSPKAYDAMMNGLSSDLLISTKSNFPVIFDSGASRSISGCLEDFISPPTEISGFKK